MNQFERGAFSQGWVGGVAWRIFRWRKPLLACFLLLTIGLALSATGLKVSAGFTKMIPLTHPYMRTFLAYQKEFGGANKVLVALKSRHGDIYSKAFMASLRGVTDEVFFIKGVERSSVTSLFTNNVRYNEVVEDGFRGGNIVASDFVGTPDQLKQVKENILKSDWVGRIVAKDMSAALVAATLQDTDPDSGQRLDLQAVARSLEQIRAKYENDQVKVEIIGFAKAMGDIAAGATGVLLFFALAFVITAFLLYWYCRSGLLTAMALVCAMVPVVWLLGLLPLLGLTLDPMSILVPFLIFSIGVSHAVQMTNAWKLEILAGHDGLAAACNSFQKLFIPGAMALLANALGFLVIALIDIEMVRELALTATIGVSVMIVTNKMLLPILLSYRCLSDREMERHRHRQNNRTDRWQRLGFLATRKGSVPALLLSAALLAFGLWQAEGLRVGDLGQGVPELRAESRYNQDIRGITHDFAIGVDLLQIIAEAKGQDSPCVQRPVMEKLEDLEFTLNQDPGVATVRGLAGFVKNVTQGYAETFIKWRMLPEETAQIAQGVGYATRLGNELMNSTCTAMPISVFTADHQAGTIRRIIDSVKRFKAANDTEQLSFQLATGNVGVMAATNEAVEAADKWVNLALFASVSALCLLTFRSLRVTLCIILPLALVTVLCNALMAMLGIGVKVSTLPVVALGVGVGVDYGIYLFERMKHEVHERNHSLREAFVEALRQRGAASIFTAITMTVSVASWGFSSLKFQADMGVLLAFMFLVNMVAAILLLPPLAAWLVGERLRQSKGK
jgi:predicted RND superfamily exporter protein